MSNTCQTNFVTARVRVALIIEGGKIKPVWFEQTDNSARETSITFQVQLANDRVFTRGMESRNGYFRFQDV